MRTSIVIILLFFVTAFPQTNREITAAVIAFNSDYYPTGISKLITDKFLQVLLQNKEYKVVERSEIDKVLDELGFQQTGCTDNSCAISIGKILNAERVFLGNINNVNEMIVLIVKEINVQTGEILKTYETTCKGCQLDEFYIDNIPNIFNDNKQISKQNVIRVFAMAPEPVYVDNKYFGRLQKVDNSKLYMINIWNVTFGFHKVSVCSEAETNYSQYQNSIQNEKLMEKAQNNDATNIVSNMLLTAKAKIESDRCSGGQTNITIDNMEAIDLYYDNNILYINDQYTLRKK
ncbi:MAG: hypothetical protein JW866_07770 [Ignavibacteriales bacterium]|nr:hypothetical protein [Ignavibacteriales bacterium]